MELPAQPLKAWEVERPHSRGKAGGKVARASPSSSENSSQARQLWALSCGGLATIVPKVCWLYWGRIGRPKGLARNLVQAEMGRDGAVHSGGYLLEHFLPLTISRCQPWSRFWAGVWPFCLNKEKYILYRSRETHYIYLYINVWYLLSWQWQSFSIIFLLHKCTWVLMYTHVCVCGSFWLIYILYMYVYVFECV